MSGRTSSDGDIIRHQQERDLGHERPEPGRAHDWPPNRKGLGGEGTGRKQAPEHDDTPSKESGP